MRLGCGMIRGAVAVAASLCVASSLEAQRIPLEKRVFNEEVLRGHGQPVIPIYEGWYENEDGTFDICFGYFNLNTEEPVDIPLGDRNMLSPSQYDGKQPTHFAPVPGMTPVSPVTSRFRRYWCAFTVTVPRDFGQQGEVRWTLQRQGGEVVSTPGTLNPAYILDEPTSDGRGDVAPVLRFSENGPSFQGRHGATAPPMTVRVGAPLQLSLWVEHPFEEEVWVGWEQYQGPGPVTFGPTEQDVRLTGGRGVATTTARFSEPGEYQLFVQSISDTNAFEFHCCWTNGYVTVIATN